MFNMKVSSELKVYDLYKAKNPVSAQRVSRAEEKRDIIALSSQAKDYSLIRNELSKIPNIRSEKIDFVQNKINTVGYSVSGKDIANKIVDCF